MPIIPRYNLSQTSTHVNIEVSIPHVRVSTATLDLVIVDGTEVHLYAPPTYLLKLTLPNRVVSEDDVDDSLARAATIPPNDGLISVVEEESTAEDDKVSISCAQSQSTTEITEEVSKQQYIWTKEDLPKLQYNPEKNHGTLTVIIRKEEEGIWDDLDLLGRLQQQPKTKHQAIDRTSSPLIKVIDGDKDEIEISNDNDNNNISSTSQVMEDLLSVNNENRPNYGLFQHFSNVFKDYAREGLAHEMLECPNPDEVYKTTDNNVDGDNIIMSEQQNRREMRIEMENEKFDTDRYLNDLCVEEEGDMIFDSAMQMVPHWAANQPSSPETSHEESNDTSINNVTSQLSKLSTTEEKQFNTFFTAEESHLLATLPPQSNIPIQLSAEQKRSAFLSLTDILFAYVYDHRTTDGDPTVESSWTVMILSPSLSWLENYNPPYDTISDIIRWNIRRSLIYPYLRSYALAIKLANDVCQIIKCGRRTIIRCLLQLHQIMEKSETHYLFNKLYIGPLLGWIQRCEETEVIEFGKEVKDALGLNLLKDNLGLGLVELESSFLESTTSSSEEEDNNDDEVSYNYESDSDSRGVEDATVSTADEQEEV